MAKIKRIDKINFKLLSAIILALSFIDAYFLLKYDHFSMAPVEAMSCGCPCVSFDTPTIAAMDPKGWVWVATIQDFANVIVEFINNDDLRIKAGEQARQWARQFEYKDQVTRVFNNIKQELFI